MFLLPYICLIIYDLGLTLIDMNVAVNRIRYNSTLYLFVFSFLLFVGLGSGKKVTGKESCEGADICYMDEHGKSDFSAFNTEQPIMKAYFSGLFSGLDGDEYNVPTDMVSSEVTNSDFDVHMNNNNSAHGRSLYKRLGLDACCNGIYNEPPRKRKESVKIEGGLNHRDNQAYIEPREIDSYDIIERGGFMAGDPPA